MTDEDKLDMLIILTGEKDYDLLTACLDFAKEKILLRAYPFGDGTETIPERYDQLHIQMAEQLYLRRGSEGETVHLENGVSRHFEDGDIPLTLLRQVTPLGGVL